MGKGWQSVRLEEIDPIAVVDGKLLWRPIRRTLDVGAFGINAYVAPNAGDDVVEEHTEQSLGHEELYLVLAGRATFTLDDETLDAPAGTVVFVREPTVKRHARAEEPGTAVLVVGGPRGRAYEPSPWEYWFAAERHRASGDFDAMADEIADGLEQYPDHPAMLYYLARAEALAGRPDDCARARPTCTGAQAGVVGPHPAGRGLAALHELPGWPPACGVRFRRRRGGARREPGRAAQGRPVVRTSGEPPDRAASGVSGRGGGPPPGSGRGLRVRRASFCRRRRRRRGCGAR